MHVEKGNSDVEYTFHLFVRPKDPRAEQWDGARSGIQAAQDVFNADEVCYALNRRRRRRRQLTLDQAGDVNHIPSLLPEIINRAKEVYTDVLGNIRSKTAFSRYFSGATTSQTDGFQKLLRESNVKPLRPLLNKLRLVKSENEILNMRKAGQVSGRVITDAMRTPFSTEKDLWTTLEYGYRINGLDGSAYVPVVAGGQNGLSIHYVRNDHTLKDGEMVLVDSGGEYGGYITDITRTWPVNGKFTDPQRDLYEAILKVQRSVISLCREDADVSLDKLHRITENGLREGLKGLGFDMSGDVCCHSLYMFMSVTDIQKALDKLFPHHVGHYIGLDVHDAPGYPRTDRLKAGHCVTVEP